MGEGGSVWRACDLTNKLQEEFVLTELSSGIPRFMKKKLFQLTDNGS